MAAITTSPDPMPPSASASSATPQTFKISLSDAQTHLGGKPTQQDCGFALEMDEWSVIGTFDGHGADGFSNIASETAASFVSRPEFYEELKRDVHQTAETLFEAMQRSNFEFALQKLKEMGIKHEVRHGHIYCKRAAHLRGGTTATLVFMERSGLVTTMNVGDSDAWMYSESVSTKLTAEHSPETPEEYDRLMSVNTVEGSAGKESLRKTQCVYDRPGMMMPRGSTDEIPSDAVRSSGELCPYYICNLDKKPATLVQVTDEKGRVHKLAMTRAIGDENLRKGGVISRPSVSQHQITESSVIKIASDGYWDAIKTADELDKTRTAIDRIGLNANELASDWFTNTKAISDRFFGGVGDNMWGYIATIELN